MKIGIDIDGTINNFQDVAAKYLKQDYGINFDDSNYELYTGLNKAQIKEFNEKHQDDFLNDVTSLPHSQEVIKDLLSEGNRIYIITARYYSMADPTLEWLRMNQFAYNEIYFNAGNKVDVCAWKDIDVMIDDNPHNLMALAKHDIPFITFKQNYNDMVYGELYKSNDWENIHDFLTFFGTKIK